MWKDTGRQIREHLDRDPRWRSVTKIAFLDGLDESYNEAAYEKMLYYGKLLHDAMGRGWFKYRVDGGYARPVMERLSKEVELWVCHTEDFDIDGCQLLSDQRRRHLVLRSHDLRTERRTGVVAQTRFSTSICW